MAKKDKVSNRSPKQQNDEPTKVTRITAADSAPKEKKRAKATTNSKPITKKSRNPLAGLIGYFKGAWAELRQVRWPNRRTTWGLTLAVLAFSAFFVILITLLDLGFQLLFEKIF